MRNHLGAKGTTRLLYFNVDTLALWFPPGRWTQETLGELDTRKALAAESPQVFERGAYKWEVLSHGSSGFAYILRGASSTITIQKKGGARVVVRAALLAELGPDACVEEMTAIIGSMRERGHMGEIKSPPAQVSRMDICADIETECFGVHELQRMVTRARSRTVYGYGSEEDTSGKVSEKELDSAMRAIRGALPEMDKAEVMRRVAQSMNLRRVWRDEQGEIAVEHKTEGLYFRGRESTGITLGRGEIMLRVYDKIEEENQTRKGFIKGVWEEAGWADEYIATGKRDGVPVEQVFAARTPSAAKEKARRAGITGPKIKHQRPVTRFEFQLRKGGLDTFAAIRRARRAYETVREHVGAVWRYLVGSWATLRVDDGTPRPTRWPVDPVWRHLQLIEAGGEAEIRRTSLGTPPRWVGQTIKEERSGVAVGAFPWVGPITPDEQERDPDRTMVRAEARRRGLHESRGRKDKGAEARFGAVLDNAEREKLDRLAAQGRGIVAAMAALLGGEGAVAKAARILARIEEEREKIDAAEARLVYRGAQALEI